MGNLVGRRSEERAVATVLDAGGVAVLVGPAGIGKTALAREALSGRNHLEGGGLALLAEHRYMALERAVRRALDGEPDAMADQLVDDLDGRVLFIDDLHWTDEATIRVLTLMAGHTPMLITARRDGLGDAHRRFVDDSTVIDVAPMPPRTARRLARIRHPDLDANAAGALVDAARGNPLLIETLATRSQLSPSLTSAVASRLSDLDAAERDALGRAALVGRPAAPEVIGVPPGHRLSGLVRVRNGLVEVAHALIGDAVVELLDEPAMQRLHVELADRLPEHEAARHELQAGRHDEAHLRALRAADGAGVAERADLLSIAAATSNGPESYGDRCRLDAADALLAAGRWGEALQAVDRVLGTGPSVDAEKALHRGRAHWLAGDIEQARAALDDGVAAAGHTDGELAARLALERAYFAVRHDTSGRVAVAEAALDATRRAAIGGLDDESRTVLAAQATLGAALLYDGQAGWEDLLAQVSDAALAAGDVELSCTAMHHLSSGLGFMGRGDLSSALAERQAATAREHGLGAWVAHFEATVLINRGMAGGHGEWVRERSLAFLAAHPAFRNRYHAHTALLFALSDLGAVEEAGRHAELAVAEARTAEAELMAAIGSAEVSWLRRDAETLARDLTAARSHGDTWFGLRFTVEVAAFHLAVERDEPFAARSTSTVLPQFWAGLHDVAGLQAWQDGDGDLAIAELDRAVEAWQAVGTPRFAARSAGSAATLARRLGRRDAATRQAGAITIARDGRLLGLLDRMGAPRTDGLTPREEAVMLLVAGGRTTAQIASDLRISPATVDSHVRSVCRKLGAANRRDAALQVAGHS